MRGLHASRVAPEEWRSVTDWDDVVAASARPSVFLTRDWVSAWWSCFGRGLEPHLVRIADEAGCTVGVAPFYVRAHGVVRRLGFIGDQRTGSEYLGLAARAGWECTVADASVRHLDVVGARWDVALLHGLRRDDPAAGALTRRLSAGASRVGSSPPHPASLIRLPRDFDAYLARLSPKFRQSYRQRTNKLLRTHAVRFVMTSSDSEVDYHLDRLFAMHQAHWTAAGHLGVFADPGLRSFYGRVARSFLAAGWLRFWHLEIDGVIRASQFGFVYGGVLHSLQEGYDTAFVSRGIGGLGVVLRGHVLKCCIEEGLDAYDFLGGDEEFKQRWRTSTHYLETVRASAPGIRGATGWVAMAGHDRAKVAFKELAPDLVLRTSRQLRLRAERWRRATLPG